MSRIHLSKADIWISERGLELVALLVAILRALSQVLYGFMSWLRRSWIWIWRGALAALNPIKFYRSFKFDFGESLGKLVDNFLSLGASLVETTLHIVHDKRTTRI